MTLRIEKAADWYPVETELREYLRNLGHNSEVHAIVRSFSKMIAELGDIEVEQRRLHRTLPKHAELVDKINQNLLDLEKHIFMVKLAKKATNGKD